MLRKKKILFIIWSYTYGGGAEALLTMIVNHLNPEKYDISIIEYEHAEHKVELVKPYIHVLPPIERVETPDHQKKGYQVYHTPEILIEKYIRGDYDLYVSFNYQIPTFLLPRGTKNIAWIHTDVYDLSGEAVQREWALQDSAFDKVERIIAISDRTYQSLWDLFPRHQDKILKLYNGFDIDRIKVKSEAAEKAYIKKPAIMFFGRLEKRKHPERLINVFSLIHETNKNVHLYYVGDGEEKDTIISMVYAAGIEEYVHLLGYRENPFPIIKQADAICQFSQAEGFQMCLGEALALGVPIVATDAGMSKVLTNFDKCGRVVSTDKEAAAVILELLEADRDALRRECQESIQRFALEPYIARIEELFDEVLES